MARRKRVLIPPRHARLEIVPMIDVMMFLLVFFVMIALSMIPNAGLTIALPGATASGPLPPAPLVIAVARDGGIHADGEAIPLDDVARRIARHVPAVASVVVAADRDVDFQHVILLMDAVRRAGITQIGVATNPTSMK